MVLRSDVFYEAEYRELCIQQLSLYQPSKMSLSYLKDLVETTHVFLKLMEHMSKTSHIMISSKKTKRVKPKSGGAKKPGKSGLTSGGGDGFISQRESNEQIWDTISLELSRILQVIVTFYMIIIESNPPNLIDTLDIFKDSQT